MKPCTVKIFNDPIDQSPKIVVAGHDISNAARSVTLHVAAGQLPQVEVQLSSRETLAEFPEAVVKVVSWRSPNERQLRQYLDQALTFDLDPVFTDAVKAWLETIDKTARGEI